MLTLFLLCGITLLLIAGIVPVLGPEVFVLPNTDFTPFPTHLYDSPVFIALLALTALWSLISLAKNPKCRKNILLWIVHVSLIAVCVTGYMFAHTRRESAPFRLNYRIPDYRVSEVVMMPDKLNLESMPDDRARLGFEVQCVGFTRTQYTPDYDYADLSQGGPAGPKIMATLPLTEKGVCYGDSVLATPERLQDAAGTYVKFLAIGDNKALALRERDKFYSATMLINGDTQLLEVNDPIKVNSKRLYLIDYDENNIIVNMVDMPYEMPLKISLIVFFASLCILCLTQFFREDV